MGRLRGKLEGRAPDQEVGHVLPGAMQVVRGIGLAPVLEELTHREGSWPTATSGAGDGMGPAEEQEPFPV